MPNDSTPTRLPVTVSIIGLLYSFAAFGLPAAAATLEVGPGKTFKRIEEANAKAQSGDVVLVYPLANDRPYEKTAVYVRQKNLIFRAVPKKGSRWVKISGKGFDYSGRGSTPRAIFQFNRGTDDCVLEGFELTDAHNQSHNGAGVRINQANRVVVHNCNIHRNDMGIMSNGDGTLKSAVNQRIENCIIHHNGNFDQPGYNHNLYLGGTSVTLSGCEVHSSLTGHNVKSRAHHTRVEYCYVHHSANREFDLVDGTETTLPESHAVLLGNIIVKDPKCKGNRTVLHFGQDGGREHDGTAYLIFNTIVTPFISPVVDLSSPGAKAHLLGNLVCDGGTKQNNQKIAVARGGAKPRNITGKFNWLSGNFTGASETGLDPKQNLLRRIDAPMFVDVARHDYRLRKQTAQAMTTRLPASQIKVPPTPGEQEADRVKPLTFQYRHPGGTEKRPVRKTLTLGAYAR